jgi:hypothetical protein
MNLPPELNHIQENPMMENMNMENEQDQEPIQILAHVDPNEIPLLNEMQGREIIDPETNLRDYTLLSYLAQLPEYQEALMETKKIAETKKMAEGGQVKPGRPIIPELEEMRRAGTGKDTELIIITPELADIFNEWNDGKTTINPITGAPEYGFFTELLRVAAPIVGAILGGPIGAFAGSVAANKATGKSWGNSLKQGAFSAGITMAFPTIGGAFAGSFPGAASTLGGFSKSVLGNAVGGGLNNLFTPSAQGSGILSFFGGNGAKGATAGMTPGAMQGAQAGMSPASGIGSGILSSLGSNIIPLAAAGFMAHRGHQQEQKALQDYEAKQRAEYESIRNRPGFNTPWKKPKPYSMELRPGQISAEDLASGKQRQYFEHAPLDKIDYELKDGGPIQGRGKGQQDNIPKNIKENSYIIDASTVSDIGDGSSEAGIKELNNFFAEIPSYPAHEKRGGFIKALVSNDEFEVTPEQVAALGRGSNKKGAKILDNMIKQIRQQKRTSGNKLPPKSKPLGGYLRNLQAA